MTPQYLQSALCGDEPTCRSPLICKHAREEAFGRDNECAGNLSEGINDCSREQGRELETMYLQEGASHVHLLSNLVNDILSALENWQTESCGSE